MITHCQEVERRPGRVRHRHEWGDGGRTLSSFGTRVRASHARVLPKRSVRVSRRQCVREQRGRSRPLFRVYLSLPPTHLSWHPESFLNVSSYGQAHVERPGSIRRARSLTLDRADPAANLAIAIDDSIATDEGFVRSLEIAIQTADDNVSRPTPKSFLSSGGKPNPLMSEQSRSGGGGGDDDIAIESDDHDLVARRFPIGRDLVALSLVLERVRPRDGRSSVFRLEPPLARSPIVENAVPRDVLFPIDDDVVVTDMAPPETVERIVQGVDKLEERSRALDDRDRVDDIGSQSRPRSFDPCRPLALFFFSFFFFFSPSVANSHSRGNARSIRSRGGDSHAAGSRVATARKPNPPSARALLFLGVKAARDAERT